MLLGVHLPESSVSMLTLTLEEDYKFKQEAQQSIVYFKAICGNLPNIDLQSIHTHC